MPTIDTVFALSPSKDAVFTFWSGQEWRRIGSPAGLIIVGVQLLHDTASASEDVNRWNLSPDNWSRIDGPAFMSAANGTLLADW